MIVYSRDGGEGVKPDDIVRHLHLNLQSFEMRNMGVKLWSTLR
jgi:hypothetical protein